MPSTNTTADDRVGRVIDLLTESSLGRWQWVQQAFNNDIMYLGHIPMNEVPLSGLSYILINKTSQAIVSHAQVQTETRPRCTVTARTSGGEPEFYVTRAALESIRNAIDAGLLPAFSEDDDDELMTRLDEEGGEAAQEEPTSQVESEGFPFEILDTDKSTVFRAPKPFLLRLQPLMQPWQTLSGAMAAPLLTPEDIVQLDDAVTAECVKNNLDISWDMDDRDLWLRNNIVNCLKFGTQGAMFSFDREGRMSKVFDIHLLNLFLPPNCTGVKDAEYVIVREITSAREAKERFSYAKKTIEEYETRSTNGTTLTSSMGEQPPYLGVNFGRNMVEIWHIWLRNERYPMSPDEAIDQGRVVLRDGAMLLTDDEYNVTDEAASPGQSNWPKKLGIRYQQMIGSEMVYDEPCAHFDIPVVINQNIPVSYSPWHQGEPERLWFPQKLIDKLSSIIIDHLTYFRSPQQVMPLSVYKKWQGLKQLHSSPGRDTYLDDTTFGKYSEFFLRGKGFFIDPPTLSAQYVDLWRLAMTIFDQLSGHVGVLQGTAPGANSSGKVVEELQNAARATIGFKAAATEAMLKQLARLDIDAWSKWMPLFMWKKANDQYPVEVLAAARKRSRNMEFDVMMEVASGGGTLKKQKLAQAMEEVGIGLRSPESYRRMAEINDDIEWISPQEMAAQQAAAQPQQEPPLGSAA